MRSDTEKLYRPCVGIVLLNHQNHVFLGERCDHPGAWQMPQGGIDADETAEQAAFRELAEEIGTNAAEILKIADETLRYDLPDHLRKTLWGGRFAGQEQTWIAMRYLGKDSDINLNAHTPPEFKAWQWAPLAQTPDLIVPFKRETYKSVIAMFEPLIR